MSTNDVLIAPSDILEALAKLANAGALKLFKMPLMELEKVVGSKVDSD